MKIQVINPAAVTVGILFPPIQIQREALTEIYSTTSKQCPDYIAFNFLAQGGARISKGDGSYAHIEPDKVQIHDFIRDLSFVVAKERIVGIFDTIFAKVKPQAFLVTGIKLVAQIDTGDPSGATKFIYKTLGDPLKPEKVEYYLEPKLTGVGLRLSMRKDQPSQSVYELRIEPFFQDLSKIFVDLDVQFPGPTKELGPLEERLDTVNNYLKKNVKEFLSAL